MIEIQKLTKIYTGAARNSVGIEDINLSIEDGDIYGIIGPSGAGKSTLVRCINYLERPTCGSVILDGVDLGTLSKKELLHIRRSMSMIFQSFNLFSQRTILENVCYPLEITGVSRKEARKKAMHLLSLVGLDKKANKSPSQLSGGQKQRVAIARALATDPKVLLCDEPTSALDPANSLSLLSLLKDINKKMGVTVIIITHQMKVIEQLCTKVAVISGGHVAETGYVRDVFSNPKTEAAKELISPKFEMSVKTDSSVRIRLYSDGNEKFESLVSDMIIECGTAVSIPYVNIKENNGVKYSEMLLQLPDGTVYAAVRKFLEEHNIRFEEVGG